MPSETAARILVIGTGDTKAEELLFMKQCIEASGGRAVMMDVSVLGDPPYSPDHDKHAVARAVDVTIAEHADIHHHGAAARC
ncbi:Tm-1-like ATP-binding domain-containing protein, partial [Mesorhizobium sp.]|uniref:Tm-1-like ATP-binding domain-containing protein n=1 Tax=Mesorhizobium sp. TaxID=1871066 RepID=UPI0025EBC73D